MLALTFLFFSSIMLAHVLLRPNSMPNLCRKELPRHSTAPENMAEGNSSEEYTSLLFDAEAHSHSDHLNCRGAMEFVCWPVLWEGSCMGTNGNSLCLGSAMGVCSAVQTIVLCLFSLHGIP